MVRRNSIIMGLILLTLSSIVYAEPTEYRSGHLLLDIIDVGVFFVVDILLSLPNLILVFFLGGLILSIRHVIWKRKRR